MPSERLARSNNANDQPRVACALNRDIGSPGMLCESLDERLLQRFIGMS